MPAVLDESTGRAAIAYVGDKPWHGQGQELTEDAPIEVWAREACLEWKVEKTPVLYRAEDSKVRAFPKRVVLRRSDTKAGLSVVSDRYIPVQPGQILEFFRDLVAVGGMKLHTAGSLREGRRIWAMAKLDDGFELPGGDRIVGNLLLATGCDGVMPTIGKFTTVRVVCQNTMDAALADGAGIRVTHSHTFDPEYIKAQLGLGHEAMQNFATYAQILAKRKVTEGETVKYAVDVFGNPELDANDDAQPKRVISGFMRVLKDSPGSAMPSANGTAWGLLNGVTYFIDHARKAKNQDYRLDSAWFGRGADQKSHALDTALALAA